MSMTYGNPLFLNHEDLDHIKMDMGTPCFVYDESTLRKNAQALKAFPHAFGLFPRYAMKAAPTAAILRIFNEEGLGIDASSVFEVERAVRSGIWNGSYFHEFPRALGRLAILG